MYCCFRQPQQPRRIETSQQARTPVPPPPQPVRPTQASPAVPPQIRNPPPPVPRSSVAPPQPPPTVSTPVRIFQEDDLTVPTVGGNTDDFFGAFQSVMLGGGQASGPAPSPTLPSFPAIPVTSDRSRGVPDSPMQFGPFQHVPL